MAGPASTRAGASTAAAAQARAVLDAFAAARKGKARAIEPVAPPIGKQPRIRIEERLAADKAALELQQQQAASSSQASASGPSSSSISTPQNAGKMAWGPRGLNAEIGEDRNMLKRSSADMYFDAFSGSSAAKRRKVQMTSDNVTSKMGLSPLTPEMVSKVRHLPASDLASGTEAAVEAQAFQAGKVTKLAVRAYRKKHPYWTSLLSEGHSLLFHGVGSAEPVLEDYVKMRAEAGMGSYIIVRGYMPGMRPEKILETIEKHTADCHNDLRFKVQEEWVERSVHGKMYLEAQEKRRSELAENDAGDSPQEEEDMSVLNTYSSHLETRAHMLRDQYLYDSPFPPLYVVLIGLDRPALLSKRSQQVISILGHAPRIHLLATANHINAGFLLGPSNLQSRGDKFIATPRGVPWLWQDLPTFIPPVNEMLVSNSKKTIRLPRAFSLQIQSNNGRRAGGANELPSDQEPLQRDFPLSRAQSVLQSLNRKTLRLVREISLLQLGLPADTDLTSLEVGAEAQQSRPFAPVLSSAAYDRAAADFIASNPEQMRNMLTEIFTHGIMRLAKWNNNNDELKRLTQGQEYFWMKMSPQDLCQLLKWLPGEIQRKS